jgi:hypothetical protein
MLVLFLSSLWVTLVAYGSFLDGLRLFNSFLRLIVATVALYLLTGETLFIFFFRHPLTFGVFVV